MDENVTEDSVWAHKTVGIRFAVVQLPNANSEVPAIVLAVCQNIQDANKRVNELKASGKKSIYVQTMMDLF